jgi:hypothetical protein
MADMALWVIDLNDSDLRVFRDGALVDASPGVAVTGAREILTGSAAQARRFLEPRRVRNRFWQQLNQAPLAEATARCRHHADLAYHHLEAILARCGRPSEAVLAVPAHYGNDELALLLGIAGALGLSVAGLVDSSVAALAGCAPRGRYAVADLFQHHATLVEIDVADSVIRGRVETIEPAARGRIEAGIVDLVADAFLDQARFDPLHDAASEQLLHDCLPGWLARANSSTPALEVALDYRGQRFTAQVSMREIERVTAMVLGPLVERVQCERTLVLTASFGDLPGASSVFAPSLTLASDAIAVGIAEHRLAFGTAYGGTVFVTELPATRAPALATLGDATGAPLTVTHLLLGAHARALGPPPLALAVGATRAVTSPGDATVSVIDGQAVLDPGVQTITVNQRPIAARVVLNAGDRISFGDGHTSYLAIHAD